MSAQNALMANGETGDFERANDPMARPMGEPGLPAKRKALNFKKFGNFPPGPSRCRVSEATDDYLARGRKITVLAPGPAKLFSRFELDFWSQENHSGVY